MNVISRCIRFYIHESVWWLAGLALLFVQITWKFWGQFALVPLLVGAAVAFMLPWCFSRPAALKYESWKRLLMQIGFGVLIVILWLRFAGEVTLIAFIFTYYLSFTVGFFFWTVTDDIYEMINWLAHPLEYGRSPDEIYLLAQRRDAVALHRLWRFRYDDKWDVGITGIVTFAFEDGRCNTLSPNEMFDEYLDWYDREKIGDMVDEAIDELFE